VSDPIESELVKAQKAYTAGIERLRARRAAAVLAAREARWTTYRIARTLGVDIKTVDAILKAANKDRNGD
jgi:predicted transcriptional regulator